MSSSASKPELGSENMSSPLPQQRPETQQQSKKEESSQGEQHQAATHDGSKSPRLKGTGTRSGRMSLSTETHRAKYNETSSPPSPSSPAAERADVRKAGHQTRRDEPKGRETARSFASDRHVGERLDSAVPPPAHRGSRPVHGSAPQNLATRSLLIGSYVMCIGIIVLCVVALVRAITLSRDETALTTSGGIVYGSRLTTASGAKISQFLGVPYALDTAGPRRFRDPVPFGRFPQEMWKALEHGPACTQWLNGSVQGSEDCLHLSLWMPAHDEGKSKRSVVLALTGDWFQTGNTASDGAAMWAELAAGMKGVVVAPNHRLGVFGFLDVGVRGLLGNVALQDVFQAMSWIEKNADALNVDTDDVAAFGLGSGAYLLSLLLMSSSTANDTVFRRAFLQGPCPTAPLPRNTPQMGRAYLARMSLELGCYQPRIADQADCLRLVTQEQILKASLSLGAPIRFVPSALNGETLSSLHETAWFAGVEVLLGSDVTEGKRLYDDVILPWAKVSSNSTTLQSPDVFESVRTFLRGDTGGLEAVNHEDAMNVVASNDIVESIVHLFTTCPSKKMAHAVSARNGTLFHYVTKGGSVNDVPFEMEDIAGFLSKGVLPHMKNGSLWPSYGADNFTRMFPESAHNVADVAKDDICDKTERLLRYLE
ncbi:acetylcholinesterase-like isoform X2 [Dermacentor albipictus]|uniref:acetylcholinesterase-like isoform X2 n=1 Tax=Dermacentor albipictus TaxID=60249 RepID=UPI0038FCF785